MPAKTASTREGEKCTDIDKDEMADIMWITLVIMTDDINALATIKRVIDNK